ncbi:MAG: flagellar basal-body MS-ring/collar protein FliF [Deltaproteobacteria bacterium]|jgi:flagellar M-ring protein FliF
MNLLETVKTWWKDAPPVSRAAGITGLVGLVLFGAWFASTDPTHNWVPITQEPMSLTDAGQVKKVLAAKGVQFRIEETSGGSTVLVPMEQLTDLKMTLLEQGVDVGQSFDPYKSMFESGGATFTTASMEQAMRTHAKEKSIEMKLAALKPVKRAMVNLAVPKNSILEHTSSAPKASVVIELARGYGFTKELAVSIQDTVAHAVEGLHPDKVSVTDHLGRRVGVSSGDPATALASRSLALRQEQESQYEERIIQLLEPIVGQGRVVARVSARMDMSRVEQRSEEYDPDNAVVRRERTSKDTASSQDRGPARAAGVGGNGPQRPAGGNDGPSSSTNNENSVTETDYAVPKKITESTRPMGSLERLSVAVVIDSTVMEPPADEPPAEGEGETKEQPVDVEIKTRRAAPIPSQRALAEIVKKAVGFDPVRGDQVEVLYAPFNRPTFEPEEFQAAETGVLGFETIPPWIPFSGVMLFGFVLVAFAMFRTEKARKLRAEEHRLREEEEEQARIEAERKAAEEMSNETMGQVPIKEEVKRMASANLNATTQVMKEWLSVRPL